MIDPLPLLMLALLAVLAFFMFRNSKKHQQQMRELQDNLRPGAEVMLTSGIFCTVEQIEDGAERATVRLGDNLVEVLRQAIAKVVTPLEAPEGDADLAPDDDPAFGDHVSPIQTDSADAPDSAIDEAPEGDEQPKN